MSFCPRCLDKGWYWLGTVQMGCEHLEEEPAVPPPADISQWLKGDRMSTWLEEHLYEVVDRFAVEDHTSNSMWQQRAVLATARTRMLGSMEQQGYENCADWLAGQKENTQP